MCHTGRARPAAKRKVGAGDTAFSAKEQLIHEKGLIALNTPRRAEEAQGHIRWLRPEFQAPSATQTSMAGLGDSGRRNQKTDEATSPQVPPAPTQQAWPQTLPDQLAAIARILTESTTAQTETQLAAHFTGKGRWEPRLPGIITALEALGRARRLDDGRWMG